MSIQIYILDVDSLRQCIQYFKLKHPNDVQFFTDHSTNIMCKVKLNKIEQEYRNAYYYEFHIPSRLKNYFVNLYYNV